MELQEQMIIKDGTVEETKHSMRKAGLFFCLLILLELPLSVLIAFFQNVVPADYAVLVSILMTQGYLLLGGIVYCLVAKQHLIKDLKIGKYRISSFFLSILVLITASPMASWLNVFSQLFAENRTNTAIFSVMKSIPMWLGIIIIGCLPGFIEEFLYRGIMYSAFRKRSILTGIIVSSVAFGLMHMNFNQMAYAIYLGIIFALLVEATGSVTSSMILHMLFNGANTAYVYILPKLYEYLGQYVPEYAEFDMEAAMSVEPKMQELVVMLIGMMPFAFIGLFLAVLLLRQIAKMNNREFTWAFIKGNSEEVKQTKPVNIGLILGFLICLALCIWELVMV